MDKNFNSYLNKPFAFLGFLFGLLGGIAILLMAMARHAPLSDHSKELLDITAHQQITHSLLGLLAIFFQNRLGVFGKIAVIFCAFGMVLFTIPVTLLAFNFLPNTPSAPFGGFSFALAWLLIGIGAFRYSFGLNANEEKQ